MIRRDSNQESSKGKEQDRNEEVEKVMGGPKHKIKMENKNWKARARVVIAKNNPNEPKS